MKKKTKRVGFRQFVFSWLRLRYKISALFLMLILFYSLFPYVANPLIHIYSDNYIKREIRPAALSIIGNASTDQEKVLRIMDWQSKNMVNIFNRCNGLSVGNTLCIMNWPPSICLRANGHEIPSWIWQSRCGACEEYALLFTELSNSINITARSIHHHGEDHNMAEVFLDGQWIAVDPTFSESMRFNVSPLYYDSNWGNRSYVYAIDKDGNIIDVTKRYTGTGTLIVHVKSEGDANVSIINAVSNKLTELNCTVHKNGDCKFEIGGNDYNIIAITDGLIRYSDQKNKIHLDEGNVTEVYLNVNNIDLADSIPDWISIPLFILFFWMSIGVLLWGIDAMIARIKKL